MSSKTYLILGSGAMRIGQGGEFDYSGTACVKSLKSLGHRSIVLNPNPASIQGWDADVTYYLPLVKESVAKILREQKPDGVFLGFGGQTALNLGIACESLFLKHEVLVCGTTLESILNTEDREKFSRRLKEHGFPQPPWIKTDHVSEALDFLDKYQQVILRKDYSLGGDQAQIIHSPKDLVKAFHGTGSLYLSAVLNGFLEIETEVLRDKMGTKILVASLENLDHLGIHTGDSVVVSPVQTIGDFIWQKIRSMALELAEIFQIVGECNLQFALNPKTDELYVIEMNARLSRSSALASKAVFYPIASIATRLCLGELLHQIPHPYQSSLSATWEPAMNYVAVKMPHWDWEKIGGVPYERGPAMRSIGESLAFGEHLGEAFQKIGFTADSPLLTKTLYPELLQELMVKSPVSNWHIKKVNSLSSHEEFGKAPFYCSSEPGKPFFPLSREVGQKVILVLSPGPYKIGSGIEFEWNLVWSLRTLRELGYKVVLIQPNPATVSSDPEESDRLYVEELSLPKILHIARMERVDAVLVSAAAQIGALLAEGLFQAGLPLFGSPIGSILMCENRDRFCEFLQKLQLPQPEFRHCARWQDCQDFANMFGYPLLLRPSFVLGGSGMRIVTSESEILEAEFPCLATRYLQGFIEYEVDCVSNGSNLLLHCIHEIYSQDGVHGGSSPSISPPKKLSLGHQETILHWAEIFIKELGISGGFNFQVLCHNNQLYIIELNLRFSRTFACSSLVKSINFVKAAILAICSQPFELLLQESKCLHRTPVFSEHAMRFFGPRPNIQMLATGEEVCLEPAPLNLEVFFG